MSQEIKIWNARGTRESAIEKQIAEYILAHFWNTENDAFHASECGTPGGWTPAQFTVKISVVKDEE
jgi:hypothetical protein